MHTLFKQLVLVGYEGINICLQIPNLESQHGMFLLGRLGGGRTRGCQPGYGAVTGPLRLPEPACDGDMPDIN